MPATTDDLSTIYTTPEEGDVRLYDQLTVGVDGGNGAYLIHLFKKTHDNRESNIKVRAVVKSSYAPTSSVVYLQIWNGTTLTWETIDSNNTALANADFSLDATVLVNDSNYYDFGNQIAVRVYQLNNSGGSKTLRIDQIKITFVAAYENIYTETTDQYVSVYAPVEGGYTPKYPHKNPQDDL